jgi:hypothetical protein
MGGNMHTPGPWGLEEVEDGYNVGSDETCTAIAKVDRLSDAYLIAAAPYLLEALQTALAIIRCQKIKDGNDPAWDGIIEIADSAIAKATGKEE